MLPEGVSVSSVEIDGRPHTSSRREAERAAVRLLIADAFGPNARLEHDAAGSPRIEGIPSPPFISISHSIDRAWLAVSRDTPVGIDAETSRSQLVRVAPRFLTPEERDLQPGLDLLLAYWTAKEAVYKVARTRGLDPRHIEIDLTAARATLADGRTYTLNFLERGLTLAMPSITT